MIFLIVHQKGVSKDDKVLRAFDLNYAYGSCVGISRLERWRKYQYDDIFMNLYVPSLIVGGFVSCRASV